MIRNYRKIGGHTGSALLSLGAGMSQNNEIFPIMISNGFNDEKEQWVLLKFNQKLNMFNIVDAIAFFRIIGHEDFNLRFYKIQEIVIVDNITIAIKVENFTNADDTLEVVYFNQIGNIEAINGIKVKDFARLFHIQFIHPKIKMQRVFPLINISLAINSINCAPIITTITTSNQIPIADIITDDVGIISIEVNNELNIKNIEQDQVTTIFTPI